MSGHVAHRGKCNWPFGSFVRHIIEGACNEPQPWNWYSACRRKAGHYGPHHTWDPSTGMVKGRYPRFPFVNAWSGPDGPTREVTALAGHGAYVGGARP